MVKKMKEDKKFLAFLREKQQEIYNDPDSILKAYDKFLESHYIYHSLNQSLFDKSIKGRLELCDGILELYNQAKLQNEKISLLEDLKTIGYDKNKLVELILDAFYSEPRPSNLWEYAALLYSIKNYRYMSQYLAIIKDKSYGDARQMLILLVGKSKKTEVVPILMEVVDDLTVYGHALDALSNFSGEEIKNIMYEYTNCDVTWIRKIAQKYLAKQ